MKLTKKEQLRKVFSKILNDHLYDISTIEDMQSVYVINEYAIKNIVEELLKEISIRFYIKGE
ncbi:MAG: hypothetical protein KKD48_00035 [Nanoarchaeota archaeon]|nr:hypothetical protein [Nanoarchaeota archaeon]